MVNFIFYHLFQFIFYKDLKAFTADLKEVYKAASEEAALAALDSFDDKWGKKYPLAVKSWRSNWPELSTFFKYPDE